MDVFDTTAILFALRLGEGVSRGGVFHQLGAFAGGGLRGERLESVCAAHNLIRTGIPGSGTP